MKHIKNQLKKISKDAMKKGITTLILLFFAMVMIFQKDTPNTAFQFVWNSDEVSSHNAAQDRNYLFENEEGQQTYQGEIHTGAAINTTGTLDSLINPNEVAQALSGIVSQTGRLYTGTLATGNIYSGNIHTGTQTVQNTSINITTGALDCITPWKEKVQDKDFVLAYEQRKDVNNMCNIEKRTCTNGVLGGSFTQGSCKEDVIYVYTKAEVISYNQKVLNEYIQPAAPVNAGAEFNNEGQINTTENPTTTRGTTNTPVVTKSGVAQSPLPIKASCTTPRGQNIKHGQFIKAYKAPRGFIDLACDVEIRACINGHLKGTFAYSKCTFNNTSYAEYIKAGAPASNTGFLFFQRIKSALRRGR